MTEKIGPEEVRRLIEEMPEPWARSQRERVADSLRAMLDEEPPVELIEDVLVKRTRRILENTAAQMEELTEAEYDRIISEEFARLDEGNGVDEEALSEAVHDRLRREYPYLFERRRSSPPTR